MDSLKKYINTHLKYQSGCFKLYKNKYHGYFHLSVKSNIYVDENFWTYIKTIDIIE